MTASPFPEEIKTARLRLRRPVVADAPAIFHAYAQDPQVCRFMIWAPHTSEAVTSEFLESCVEAWIVGSRLPYVIIEHGSGATIGMLEARILGSTVDIGYVLARSWWGNGLMPEAIAAFVAAALGQQEFFRVHAACDVENIPSQRALEKAGFNREGRLERYTVHPNISPDPRPCFMYAKCR